MPERKGDHHEIATRTIFSQKVCFCTFVQKSATLGADEAKLLCLQRVPIELPLCVNGQDSKAEIFDVFLCHNNEDEPAVREMAQMLVKEGIEPWLDEDEIRPENLVANCARTAK